MRKRYVWVALFLCWAGFASVGAAASDSQVIVEGSQRAAETVRASGHGVPLLRALEQIVPTSYSVNVPNAGAWADAPVSWHGDTPFVRALGEILSGNRILQARVNTDLHLVTVTALPEPVASSPLAVPAAAVIDTPPAAQTGAQPPAQTPPMLAQRQAQIPPQPQLQPQVQMPSPSPSPSQPQPQVQLPPQNPPAASAGESVLPASRTDSPLPQGTPLTLSAPAPALAQDPAPALAAAAPADPAAARTWELRLADGSVRTALARWAQDAGWQFIWAVPTDFTIDASATIHGSFEDALHSVVDALSHSQVPIQAVLYKGNHVLRVTAKGAG